MPATDVFAANLCTQMNGNRAEGRVVARGDAAYRHFCVQSIL